jgi:hypothetical protein
MIAGANCIHALAFPRSSHSPPLACYSSLLVVFAFVLSHLSANHPRLTSDLSPTFQHPLFPAFSPAPYLWSYSRHWGKEQPLFNVWNHSSSTPLLSVTGQALSHFAFPSPNHSLSLWVIRLADVLFLLGYPLHPPISLRSGGLTRVWIEHFDALIPFWRAVTSSPTPSLMWLWRSEYHMSLAHRR